MRKGLYVLGRRAASPCLSQLVLSYQMTLGVTGQPLAGVCGEFVGDLVRMPSTQVSVSRSQIPFKEQSGNWIRLRRQTAASAVLSIS